MAPRTLVVALLLATAAAVVTVQLVPWHPPESPAVLDAIATLGGEYVDRPAPPFELPDAQGQPHRLTDYRGKVVFLNFWASFCAPCVEEMPSMERLVNQYKDQGLEMVAISFDPERDDMVGFMERFLPGRRSQMTVLWDPQSEIGHRYGTELIPETYLIDRDGRIVARFVNAYDWTRPEVKQLIEALLRDERASQRLL